MLQQQNQTCQAAIPNMILSSNGSSTASHHMGLPNFQSPTDLATIGLLANLNHLNGNMNLVAPTGLTCNSNGNGYSIHSSSPTSPTVNLNNSNNLANNGSNGGNCSQPLSTVTTSLSSVSGIN